MVLLVVAHDRLKKNKRSPLTNEVMPSKQMLPNHNLRKLIDDYIHSGGAQ